ncbi:hypothetical protein ACLK29_08865 [Leptospira kirschneri]|uniref:hypothetical protein n=1 Tax=Leptospira kirschneri TaxID=29507 RepID=UPI00398AA754
MDSDNSNLIDFKELGRWSVKRSDKSKKQCEHDKVFIIEGSPFLECQICQSEVDPIWFMKKVAGEEQIKEWRANHFVNLINELNEKIENQNRLKCEHCGRFTRILK